MGKMIFSIANKLYNKKLDFRVRLFNILASAGTLLGISMGLSGLFIDAGIDNFIVNAVIAIVSFALLMYSYTSGKYQVCYIITIIFIFMILFPALFFTAGGYHSGMPSFFVFAVMFTVFMLEGKEAFLFSFLEIIIYIGICVIAFQFPETVNAFETEADVMTDIIIGFTAVSLVMGITLFYHFKLYNVQQKELEVARKKLSDENAMLEHLNQLKTEFLGNVSHELKTPLTVVSGYAQTSELQLAGQPENEAVQNKMKLISSEVERLSLMVGQILDVTRIEEGKMVVVLSPCHIDKIIHNAIDIHYSMLKKNQNQLKISVSDFLPMVFVDPNRIAQVIVNLVANAVRFTTNGEIAVSAYLKGNYVAVSVADTGLGISKENLPKVFDRYNTSQSTGTGLGLYICKHIVEEHKGSITVESIEGKGTTVTFTLPIAEEPNNEPC